MKILKPLLLGKERKQDDHLDFSLYFPGQFDTKNKEVVMNTLMKYGKLIQRVHVPPERNFKDLDSTIDFLKFLHECLRSAKCEETIGIDIHTGHGIDLETIKNKTRRLDIFLQKRVLPNMYLSIENVHKSGLSSKNDIQMLAKFARDNGLNSIKVTIDAMDLAKSERGAGDQTIALIKELQSQSLSDILNCIHAPVEYSQTLKNELGSLNLINDIFLVTEGSGVGMAK